MNVTSSISSSTVVDKILLLCLKDDASKTCVISMYLRILSGGASELTDLLGISVFLTETYQFT